MQVLGPEPQSRGCQPGSGSVPRARWFLLTDVPTAPAGGREGHSKRKMSRSPQPQTTVACEANGSWAKPGLRALQGPSWHTLPSNLGTAPCRWRRPPCSLLTPGRLRLRFASSLGVGLTSKSKERIRRKWEGEQACHRTQRPLVACGNMVSHVPRRPALPPLPTHLTRCWPIALAGIKWLPARRAPSQEVSPPAGAGRSSGTQHAGTAFAEDPAQ